MKTNVKLSRQGHKNDNGPGGANYFTLHLSQVEFNGVTFQIGGSPINMYGYPLNVVGSSIGVHGGASLTVTKEPSSPPPCENPVPRGEIMNLNRRGEYHSSSMGPWDGEGVVDIDDNILLLLPTALRIERRLEEEHAAHLIQKNEKRSRGEIGLDQFGGVRFGAPTIGIRYPRRGRYPYLTWNVCYHHQDSEATHKASEWVRGIVQEEMATFKWPEIPPRVPACFPTLGEVPGEVADTIDMSDGRELRRAIQDGKGGEIINAWLDGLSEAELARVEALVNTGVSVA